MFTQCAQHVETAPSKVIYYLLIYLNIELAGFHMPSESYEQNQKQIISGRNRFYSDNLLTEVYLYSSLNFIKVFILIKIIESFK